MMDQYQALLFIPNISKMKSIKIVINVIQNPAYIPLKNNGIVEKQIKPRNFLTNKGSIMNRSESISNSLSTILKL